MNAKSMIKGLLGSVLLMASLGQASAEQIKLTISTWAPPSHGVNATMFPWMIKQIEERTEGRVTAELKYNLAPPPAQADVVSDGLADISWITHHYTPGRFPSALIADVPGMGGSAEALAVAYWRTYEKFFKQANEHGDLMVLALHSHGDGLLHTSRKISSLSEISGMKLRIGGGVAGLVGDALGAVAINVPAPKVYETLASHAADGVLMPMEAKKGFNLTEVAEHTYKMPSGFYHTSMATIMNRSKFESLEERDQAALNELFGEELSRITGRFWDEFDAEGLEALNADADNTLTIASEADQAVWAEMTAKITQNVIDDVAKTGIDAQAAYDYFKSELAKLDAK